AIVAKLRQRITAAQIEPYFSEHRADFETVKIARVDFSDERVAEDNLARIQSGKVDFYALVQQQYMGGNGNHAGHSGKVFSALRRSELEPGLAERLFQARSNEIIGPAWIDSLLL